MAKDKSESVESDLDRMALEEIMKETKRGKERAETMGPMGWLKCPLVPTNKRFFRNVLMGTLSNQNHSNKMKDFQQEHGSSTKHRSNSSSPSNSSPRDKNVVAKNQGKSGRNGHSYSSRKYSNETTSNDGKNTKDKYKQKKGDGLGEGSHHSHSIKHTNSKHRRNYCDKKTHIETNQSRKHKLEEHKKELKHDKRVKKRKS